MGTPTLIVGDALAHPEPELVYREAILQYEALLRRHTSTGEKVDIMLHYRTLFDEATQHLEQCDRLRLLHMCFAYKRKRTILQVLDILPEEVFTWVAPLKKLVAERGRDSCFDETTEKEQQGRSPRPQTRRQRMARKVSLLRGTKDALQPPKNKQQQEQTPYLIIPTLSLAFPADFCTTYASQAPLNSLNSQNLLAYPAMLLMNLSLPFKKALRDALLSSQALAPFKAHREETCKALLDHLLRGQEKLFDDSFRQPALDDGEDAYEEEDLDAWMVKWFANRQMKGLRERGEEMKRDLKGEGAKNKSTAGEREREIKMRGSVVRVEETLVGKRARQGEKKGVRWADEQGLGNMVRVVSTRKCEIVDRRKRRIV